MDRDEVKSIIAFLIKLEDAIPAGLWDLKSAVLMATLELTTSLRTGIPGSKYERAIGFVKTIPRDKDIDGPEILHWMIHDQEYTKFYKGL